jgi:hypothetical protein
MQARDGMAFPTSSESLGLGVVLVVMVCGTSFHVASSLSLHPHVAAHTWHTESYFDLSSKDQFFVANR